MRGGESLFYLLSVCSCARKASNWNISSSNNNNNLRAEKRFNQRQTWLAMAVIITCCLQSTDWRPFKAASLGSSAHANEPEPSPRGALKLASLSLSLSFTIQLSDQSVSWPEVDLISSSYSWMDSVKKVLEWGNERTARAEWIKIESESEKVT